MPPLSQKRKRDTSELKFHDSKRRRVSEALIITGVGREFDRTLPFWRCFIDLRLTTGRVPEVVRRETRVLCRIPCKVFKHFDVVWARTIVNIRPVHVPTRQERKRLLWPSRTKGGVPVKASPLGAPAPATQGHETPQTAPNADPAVHVYTIDTFHFVHEDAYKKGGDRDRSFHVQSVVFRDAPHILQCVGSSMVSFSLIVYTSLRLVHECDTRKCTPHQLCRRVGELIAACNETGPASTTESSSKCVDNPSAAATTTQGADKDFNIKFPTQAGEGEFVQGSNYNLNASGAAFSALVAWCPPPTVRILILGMGGNSMAYALRLVVGPDALIEVVEVEPAVVAACIQMGTLCDTDANTKVHLQDADKCLTSLPPSAYDFIYMDIFEPVSATMCNLHPWVLEAYRLLSPGGLLVMNEHHLPSAANLAPYTKVFGEGNVQAVNVRGWSESIVVCVAPGDAATDRHSLDVSKTHANIAFDIYEFLKPGWLPHFSWLVKATTHRHEGVRCRLWTS